MRRYREEAEIMRKRREESKTAAEIAEEIERKFMSGNYAGMYLSLMDYWL